VDRRSFVQIEQKRPPLLRQNFVHPSIHSFILEFAMLTICAYGVVLAAPVDPKAAAAAMVAKMTVDEKVSLLHGKGDGYIGNTPAIPRLGIPPLNMNDGPQGFRSGGTTAFPSGLTAAASFSRQIMSDWGTAMGEEFYGKGSNVQLGPGLCVARVPRNGRNFEYLSGEDPYLGFELAQPVIKGIQSTGVIANAKVWLFALKDTIPRFLIVFLVFYFSTGS
jgi:beta-glucosidase